MRNRQFICGYAGGPCKMRIRTLIVAVVFVILLSGTVWSLQNPYIRNPVGLGTYPVSQTRQGLFRSPNQFDTSGNDLIVGNVRRGMHFRGSVPYQSATSFRGSVPSASFSSFLRYSAGEEEFGRDAGKYRQTRPYYNPSQTAAFTRPGHSGVFTSASASAIKSVTGSGAVGEFARTAQPSRQILADRAASDFNIRSRPMSRSMEEIERLISAEVGELTTEGVRPRAKQISDRAADLKIRPIPLRPGYTGRVGEDDSLQLSVKGELSEEIRQRFELARRSYADESAAVKESAEAGVSVRDRRVLTHIGGEKQDLFDTYEQVRRQIDDLQEALERLKATEDASETSSAIKGVWESKETKEPGQLDAQLRSFTRSIEYRASGIGQARRTYGGQAEELYGTDISAQANYILGGKSLDSFSEDKFNQYIAAAEIYQKQSRHYRAVSAYSLALIYKPDNPLAYAGKSHALFAAGEYISSALFLSRALEISPEYAAVKIDLLAILGDKEKLDSRVAEVEQWFQRSDDAELQFLLGYIYYQAGELNKAKEAIDAAYNRMPESPAVDVLIKAIEEKINSTMPQTQD